MTAPTRQQRRAAARTAPRAPMGEGVFGLLSEKQQRERLYAAVMDMQTQIIEVRRELNEAGLTVLMNKCLDARELSVRKVTDDATKALAAIMEAEPRLRKIANEAVTP